MNVQSIQVLTRVAVFGCSAELAIIGKMDWYSVRCVFAIGDGMYEERITVWQAVSEDEAIALAETEATDYAVGVGQYLGLAQSFEMSDEPRFGAEIYSLIRTSGLNEDEYLTAFFDTGSEHQRRS